jgi:hypothetical protein
MTVRMICIKRFGNINFALILLVSLTSLSQVFGLPETSLSLIHEEISTEPCVRRWLCDIDGDGRAELFSFRKGDTSRYVEASQWKDSFFEVYWKSEEFGYFHDAASGDIDQDGVEELITVGYSSNLNSEALSILKYNKGEFRLRDYPLDYRTELVSVGDVNNDGEEEIVTVRIDYRSEDGSRETILVNKMTADGLVEIDAFSGHSMTADVHVDDFDEDGIVELLVAESEGRPSPVHPEKFGPDYYPFLKVYRWEADGLREKPALSKEGFVGMPYPRITVCRTPRGKRILFSQPDMLRESYMKDNTISDPVELLTLPEKIFRVSAGDIDGRGHDSLVIETWTFDPKGPKVANSHGRGALRVFEILEPEPEVASVPKEEAPSPGSSDGGKNIFVVITGILLLGAGVFSVLRMRKG